jgi:hypothetical protein|tara:strand:- start:1261 stop:1560 length:300 start_codon:yes stop_codon:yes gene_type:complete
MPNVNGKEFPYTPEGRLAAEMAKQEADSLRPFRGAISEREMEMLRAQSSPMQMDAINEEVQRAMAMRTPSASSPKLKRKLGMTKRPTRAGTKRYGTVKG